MDTPDGQKIQAWSRLAALAVSTVALTLVLRRLDLAALGNTLRDVNLGWFLVANLSFALAFGLAAVRWHLMLHLQHLAVHSGATLRLVVIGHFFNTLLFGPAGGDLAKAHLYSRWFDHRISSILSTCVLDRIAGGIGFLLFAILTGLLLVAGEKPAMTLNWPASPQTLAWWAIVAIAILAAVWVRRRFGKTSRFFEFVELLRRDFSSLLTRPLLAVFAVGLSFFSHIFISVILLFCLKSVAQTPFNLFELLWVFPVIKLISSVPVTIAGAGVREGAALVMLGMFGIPGADAVAAALLVFLIYIIWTTIGGLLVWRNSKLLQRSANWQPVRSLSVVIPVVNEVGQLEETVRHLRKIPEICEIIVVDGGSTDGTRELAQQLGCQHITTARGRGNQLREGARAASGDAILLVHADTWLPPSAGQAVLNCLRDKTVVGGGFWKVFRQPTLLMRGSRLRCALRLHFFRRILGDQTMFVRRDSLEQFNGIPDIPLMEDFELCCRMRRIGRLALAGATASTSARRFTKLGVLRTYLRMWRVTLQYHLGTSPQRLRQIYERDHSPGGTEEKQ